MFPGGAWYSVNGWLTLGLAHMAGIVPHARADAFDEFRRNTLAAHAHAYPDHWNGILSVDDVCYAFYEADPSRCGIGFTSAYDTQIMHQPAWSLFDAIRLFQVLSCPVTTTAGGESQSRRKPILKGTFSRLSSWLFHSGTFP